MTDDILVSLEKVTRVETITDEGREVIYKPCHAVFTDVQDDGRTLKIFLKKGYYYGDDL